jgi:N-acetyl-anhydromuramyl-L-alanine amidase AmpD
MTIAFVEAKHFTLGRRNGARPKWVVIHTAETPETLKTAESLAAWAAGGMPEGQRVSWHYAVDANSIVQSVREENTAWAGGPSNTHGIHIELAGRANQDHLGWSDDFSKAMLERAAELVSQICSRWQIPIVHPLKSSVLRGQAGIIGHDQVTWASKEARRQVHRIDPWYVGGKFVTTSHTDPGPNFPWDSFVSQVQALSTSVQSCS